MRLKGCNKKIVCMKNVDGRLFEEAFFILKEEQAGADDGDMLEEANRLLAANTFKERERPAVRRLARLRDFLFGALTSALLCFLYVIFFV